MVDYLNLLAAALHVLVGAFVAYEILRLGRRAPRTAGTLVAFFLLGGAALLNDPDPLLGYDLLLAGVLDVAVAGVLVVLAFDARKLVRAAARTVDEATSGGASTSARGATTAASSGTGSSTRSRRCGERRRP